VCRRPPCLVWRCGCANVDLMGRVNGCSGCRRVRVCMCARLRQRSCVRAKLVGLTQGSDGGLPMCTVAGGGEEDQVASTSVVAAAPSFWSAIVTVTVRQQKTAGSGGRAGKVPHRSASTQTIVLVGAFSPARGSISRSVPAPLSLCFAACARVLRGNV